MALGQVDYGLMGVIGGLTAFISFFNTLLASAIARFYSFSVGSASISGNEANGLKECREWFTIAVIVHSAIPLLLIFIGYPLGVWAIENFLTMPTYRVYDCIWVFRFVCVTCLVGMINVPFSAMYSAKQYIAELTLYSFATTTINAVALYYMVTHPAVWLVRFSLLTCCLAVVPQLIICYRAIKVFPECRFIWSSCGNFSKIKEMFSYAFWQFFGSLGGLARAQGTAIIVNKMCGPIYNASMAVGNSVANHSDALSQALDGAFAPAITNLAGAGSKEKMLSMCYRASKFSTMLCLMFALPLSYELDAIINLWLKNPPPLVADACLFILAVLIVDKLLTGVNRAIFANGEISKYCLLAGLWHTSSVFVMAIFMCFFNTGFMTVFYVLFFFKIGVVFIGLPIAQQITGFSAKYWVKDAVLPIVFAIVVNVMIVVPIRHVLMSQPLFVRIIGVFVSTELVFMLSAAKILSKQERMYFKDKIKRVLHI